MAKSSDKSFSWWVTCIGWILTGIITITSGFEESAMQMNMLWFIAFLVVDNGKK